MKTEKVTSAGNPKIKTLLALQEKSRSRRESGLFVVEGRREIAHCIEAGFVPQTVFRCPDVISGKSWDDIEYHAGKANKDCLAVEVTPAVYDKIAYRGGTEGVVAEFHIRGRQLADLELPENPLVVVLESVEKPGNLGAILRSADAAGADAVIVCDPLTDLWNPNLIRASIGAAFTVPLVATTSEEAIMWLKGHGIQILTAQLQDSLPYYDTPMTKGTAIVMGTESTGLTGVWRKAADRHIMIPMHGSLDSLNVSVSAAILLYEAVRQRKSGHVTQSGSN